MRSGVSNRSSYPIFTFERYYSGTFTSFSMKNTYISPLFTILIATAILSSCTNTGSDIVSSIDETAPVSVSTPVNIPVTTTVSTDAPISSPSTVSSISESSTNITPSSNPTSLSKSINYRTDHGKHIVTATFEVTTKSDGTITSVSATMNRGDHESREYIERFNNASTKKIVGQKISSLSLESVWGASDTTDAFISLIASL